MQNVNDLLDSIIAPNVLVRKVLHTKVPRIFRFWGVGR